jgi:hypothetical protein
MKNGNIFYKGELNKASIKSKVGNINLDLQRLIKDYKYD